MTAYLTFTALKQKVIRPDQRVVVSPQAKRAEGSRMFIDVGTSVAVEDLLRGMIVQSGNDASIALAEAVGGSEEGFAQMMNREAQRLGLKNSHFANATGLSHPQQYSTAQDLALVAAALIRDFPVPALLPEAVPLQQHHTAQPQPPALDRSHGGWRQDRPYRERRLLSHQFRAAR